jgi:hypothetical protein
MVDLGPVGPSEERRVSDAVHNPDLTEADRAWLCEQFELAGVRVPAKLVWILMETIRG